MKEESKPPSGLGVQQPVSTQLSSDAQSSLSDAADIALNSVRTAAVAAQQLLESNELEKQRLEAEASFGRAQLAGAGVKADEAINQANAMFEKASAQMHASGPAQIRTPPFQPAPQSPIASTDALIASALHNLESAVKTMLDSAKGASPAANADGSGGSHP